MTKAKRKTAQENSTSTLGVSNNKRKTQQQQAAARHKNTWRKRGDVNCLVQYNQTTLREDEKHSR